jgi:hypothetical protein
VEPRVFERSVSGGDSSGLGLALARTLVAADGGRLELLSARPAVFAMFLPTTPADDGQPADVPLDVGRPSETAHRPAPSDPESAATVSRRDSAVDVETPVATP